MTNWLPKLSENPGPLYLRLADGLESAIETGELANGAKLPPLRNLAFDIKVTVGTVSRAYGLLRERGLVSGEVGRGTYVLERGERQIGILDVQIKASQKTGTLSPINWVHVRSDEINMTSTSALEVGQSKMVAEAFTAITQQYPTAVTDYVWRTPRSWKHAGQAWMQTDDWTPDLKNIVPTLGAHGGLVAVMNAITLSGDRVAFEDLSYPATIRASAMMGRRPIAVRLTDQGLDPDHFEHVCAQQHPKVVILISTINNPTLATIPLKARHRIVDIARRHNVWMIEDNTYGLFDHTAPTPIAALAPERTFHIASLSKSVAAGIRCGWVSCPQGYASQVYSAHRLSVGSMPGVLQDIGAAMVLDGSAGHIRSITEKQLRERVKLAREILSDQSMMSGEYAPFIWLTLPDPWVPGNFVRAARSRGVIVSDADEFKTGQLDRPAPFVRIALAGSLSFEDLREGLTRLKDLLGKPSYAMDMGE